jgi:WD domain, G-beta repeat
LLAEGHGDYVCILDVATGTTLQRIRGHGWYTHQIALSSDASTLVVSGTQVYIWDMKQGKLRHELGGHSGGVYSLALSSDGKTLATASAHAVRFWNMTTGEELWPETGHQEAVTFVALSDDGRLLVSGDTRSAWLWETSSGKLLRRLGGDGTVSRPVALARDGKTLVTFDGEHGTESVPAPRQGLQFWQIDTHNKPVVEPRRKVEVEGHGCVSRSLRSAFSWSYVYKGGYSDVEVRDVSTNKERCTLEKSFCLRSSFGVPDRVITSAPISAASSARSHLPRSRCGRVGCFQLLDRPPRGDELRDLRAVEVLEQCRTAEATAVLKALANGVEGARLTRAAVESLHRTEAGKTR